MKQCECGSLAINHHLHGRDGTDEDLCDVCYWRKRATGGKNMAMSYDEWKTASPYDDEAEEIDWVKVAEKYLEKPDNYSKATATGIIEELLIIIAEYRHGG